jgi:large-conductance mechanosensitive channel
LPTQKIDTELPSSETEIKTFDRLISYNEKNIEVTSGFENLVVKFNDFISQLLSFVVLSADIFSYSIKSILSRSLKLKKNSIIFLPQNLAFRNAWKKLLVLDERKELY